MLEESKNVVLAYVDAFNRGDIEALCRLFAADALVWGVLGWGAIEKVRPIWQSLIDALNIQLQVDSMIGEESRTRANSLGPPPPSRLLTPCVHGALCGESSC